LNCTFTVALRLSTSNLAVPLAPRHCRFSDRAQQYESQENGAHNCPRKFKTLRGLYKSYLSVR
jgi:hypothetical protein